MKKIEECLDLVMKSLVNNQGVICIYEYDENALVGHRYYLSPAHERLFSALNLSNTENHQLMEILREKGYVEYYIVSGLLYSTVYSKNKSNSEVGNTILENGMEELIGKVNKIEINLKGKFFISEGGFSGKHKKEQRERLLQNFALWITAIGTGLGGLYLIGKALLWLCSCN